MDYRLIFLTPAGHLADSMSFRAADEDAAIRRAEAEIDETRHMELWTGGQRIRRWPVEQDAVLQA